MIGTRGDGVLERVAEGDAVWLGVADAARHPQAKD
jgi:hypothetical protein